MKTKFEVYAEILTEDGQCKFKEVKTFKGDRNEYNALAFICDDRNILKHGPMSLIKVDDNGEYQWDDNEGEWYKL